MSRHTALKADRLVREGRIHHAPDAQTYITEGDDGTYITTLLFVGDGSSDEPYTGSCTCDYRSEINPSPPSFATGAGICSHLRAARREDRMRRQAQA